MSTSQFPGSGSTPNLDPTQTFPTPSYPAGQTPGTPPDKPKKPWYKKWWIWVIVVIILFALSQMGGGGDAKTESKATATPTPTVEVTTIDPEAEASAAAAAEADASAKASQEAAEAEASAAAQAEADAAAAAAQAALLDPASYSAISARDWQLIEKDPDSHIGEKYVIYGRVTQADASTGTEGFRADTSGEPQASWYDYDINTIVAADPEIVKTVVTDDLVTMYVMVGGSYSYDTQIGGSTTAVMVLASILTVDGTAQ